MQLEIHDLINIEPDPANYIMDPALKNAIEVALRFGQPLLLTGEPGTGKTLLAKKVALMLHEQTKDAPLDQPCFAKKPLRFNTKSTSAARDLFYLYDAIGHFQYANIKRDSTNDTSSVKDFIELQALGKAIALANPKARYQDLFKWEPPARPQSSVVLVDEIDKAPRDFTNDILNEIEEKEFYLKEQENAHLVLGKNNPQRVLVLMTSNSEKNLPDAFLRRCVFYHIKFPTPERLQEILEAQLTTTQNAQIKANIETISNLFTKIRNKVVVRKKPATAELVAFMKLLEMDGALNKAKPNVPQWFLKNITLLAKSEADIEAMTTFLENELKKN